MNRSLIHRAVVRRQQRGIVLFEALVAIAIFGFGVLGLLGLQANAVKESTNARFRSDAGLLADELIGKMWVNDRDPTKLAAAFSSPSGAQYTAWLGAAGKQGTVLGTLPANASTPKPTVVVSPVTDGAGVAQSSSITVTMYWQAPYEKVQHQYTVITQIR